jgi:DNA-binding MarR family transcriptional regulator
MESNTPRPVDPALDRVLRDGKLTTTARLVWAHLHNRSSGQRQATIARALGMDRGAVARATRALTERGLACDEDSVWVAVAPKDEGR